MDDVHDPEQINDGTTDDDPPAVILIIVVGTTLIDISSAPIFLRLAGRHSTIPPPCFLSATPSRRTIVTPAVNPVLISVALFPSLIVTVNVLLCVLISFSLALSVVRYQSRRHQTE
jgi:hypothetical protein